MLFRRLGGVIAIVFGLGYELVLRSYRWVQQSRGTQLLAAGNVRGWWLLSALLASVLIIIISGFTYFLLRKWMKVENKLLLLSTCTDLSFTVILWFLGAVLADLLGKASTGAGLEQCSSFLLWLGTIWLVVTFSRFAVLLSRVNTRQPEEVR